MIREKIKPTLEAMNLKEELAGEYGEGSFYCYDSFDNHDDDSMINPEYGLQIELGALVSYVKGVSGFRSDIEFGDVVMSGSVLLEDEVLLGIEVKEKFYIEWLAGDDIVGQEYYYGDISISGRRQKVIYKSGIGSCIDYYLFPEFRFE